MKWNNISKVGGNSKPEHIVLFWTCPAAWAVTHGSGQEISYCVRDCGL